MSMSMSPHRKIQYLVDFSSYDTADISVSAQRMDVTSPGTSRAVGMPE